MTHSFVPLIDRLPPAAPLVSVRSQRELSAAQLREAVATETQRLRRLGLAHGDRIVVGHSDPLDFLIALFAAWQAGLVAVGVNPKLSALEQDNVVATAGARAWLGELRTTLPEVEAAPSDPAPLGPDEPALLLMTSGTTGRPKGITLSQSALLARIAHNLEAIPELPLPTLCILPVFFGHGLIGNVLTPLLAGSRVYLWPGPDAAELRGFGGWLDAHDIGFMSSVPSFWKLALRFSAPPARSLARVHVGSAPLSREHWEDIARFVGTRSVFNMFGMTETANWIAGGALDAPGADAGFVGKPWGAFTAIILGSLVSTFSLGILAPLASRWANRYVLNNLRYGDRAFATDPKVGQLYGAWVLPALISGVTITSRTSPVSQSTNCSSPCRFGSRSRSS